TQLVDAEDERPAAEGRRHGHAADAQGARLGLRDPRQRGRLCQETLADPRRKGASRSGTAAAPSPDAWSRSMRRAMRPPPRKKTGSETTFPRDRKVGSETTFPRRMSHFEKESRI